MMLCGGISKSEALLCGRECKLRKAKLVHRAEQGIPHNIREYTQDELHKTKEMYFFLNVCIRNEI